MEPNERDILNTLGVTYYRVSDYEKALETLTLSDKMRTETYQPSLYKDLTFITMSLYKLDRIDEAKATLVKLQELCKKYSNDPGAQAFLAEAEKLIEATEK